MVPSDHLWSTHRHCIVHELNDNEWHAQLILVYGHRCYFSHASDIGILHSISNNSKINYVLVGNCSYIPVTDTSRAHLLISHRPLHLRNVLVTPDIIKNLIFFFCKFTIDNDATIEFEKFGFSMKDFRTRQVLLRCDILGDLYLDFLKPSTQSALLACSPTVTSCFEKFLFQDCGK